MEGQGWGEMLTDSSGFDLMSWERICTSPVSFILLSPIGIELLRLGCGKIEGRKMECGLRQGESTGVKSGCLLPARSPPL